MAALAASTPQSPVRVTLKDLVRLRPAGESLRLTAPRLRVATDLRAARLRVRADLARRKLGRQLEAAGKDGAHFAVILGDELASGQVQVRDLLAGTQRAVGVDDLARELARAEASHHHG